MAAQHESHYDSEPYPRLPFSQSHPDRLATMGAIFGLNPPNIRTSRVLEIGCATGGNLVPMAEQLPGSKFFGFDLSHIQVEMANTWIDELGLNNISIRRLDIADATHELGEFDYILCHGVYSWVPAQTQASILELVSNHLSSSGIAYVSYNTNPGWNVRGIVRDMVKFHAQGIENTHEKIAQARQLLEFMAENIPATDPYAMLLKSELDTFSSRAEEFIEHDYFEANNVPVYFHEFAASLAAHKLRYVCEADVESTFQSDMKRESLQALERISADEIRMEQYLDFLRKRTYRQSLVCHSDQKIRRTLEPEIVDRYFLESLLVRTQSPSHFRNRFNGITIAVDDPDLHSALNILTDLNRSYWTFSDLVAEIQRKYAMRVDEGNLRRMFVQAFVTGHLELHTAPGPYSYDWSGMPCASRCSRSQAVIGPKVTNLSHHNVVLSELDRVVVQMLDGTTRVEDLVPKVRSALLTGNRQVETVGGSLEKSILLSVRNLAKMKLLLHSHEQVSFG